MELSVTYKHLVTIASSSSRGREDVYFILYESYMFILTAS